MDTQKLLIFGAIGIGLYLLLVRRVPVAPGAATVPAPAVTAGYTSATVIGAPVPGALSLGSGSFGIDFTAANYIAAGFTPDGAQRE